MIGAEEPRTMELPALGEAGDACSECGSPLAADQRYCLNCGRRRAETRLPLSTLSAGAPSPAVRAATAGERDYSLLLALGGLAVLVLIVGLGVLIGRSGTSNGRVVAGPPQVVTVGGGAAAATGANAPKAPPRKKGASSARASGKPVKASPAVTALQGSSGASYERKSQRLPTTVVTGGHKAPKDHKQAGAGSSSQTIGGP